MKKYTTGSMLALLLAILSACAPASQNGANTAQGESNSIIGGKTVAQGSDLAKQVFMLFGVSDEGQFICTATLISQTHVLTAAHCVDGAKQMFAVFATDAIAKLKQGGLKQNDPNLIPVKSAKIYSGWAGAKNGAVSGIDVGDIAVLRLASAAPASMKVTKLYQKSLVKNQILVASGYGVTSGTSHQGSGVLRETNVRVAEPLVGKSEFYIDQTNGHGICSGDSGGPSFVQTAAGDLQQVGITSRGDETCAKGGLYTLVPAYLKWIDAAVHSMN